METVLCQVIGMSCASCSATVEKTLNSIEGVSNAVVNLGSEEVKFEVNPEVTSLDTIAEIINKTGYKLAFSATNSNKTESNIKLIISLEFAIPLFVFCMGHMVFKSFPCIPGWTQLLLCLPVIACCYKIFVKGYSALLRGLPTMDSLVAFGCTASFLYSLINLFLGESLLFFDGVSTILTLVTVGKTIENKSKKRASDSIKDLVNLIPSKALVLVDGKFVEKDASEIKVSDIIRVLPGQRIPCDGTIVSNIAEIDESMLTGESLPVSKHENEKVFGGTLNLTNSFDFVAEKTGSETVLSEIIEMVKQAQTSKAPIQRIADKVASYFVPVVMALSLITFILWAVFGKDISKAVSFAVGVLVIACPCSLGLATPIAVMVATGVGAKSGILFRNSQALENLGKMKKIMFDKTGTLTYGRCSIVNNPSKETLRFAAIAEQKSEHPYAKAILNGWDNLPNLRTFTAIPGMGVIARCSEGRIVAGNKALMEDNDIAVPESEIKAQIYVAVDGAYIGAILLKDTVKEDSFEAVTKIKAMGIEPSIITGDNKETAEEVAKQVGIKDVSYSLLPKDKLEIIENTSDCIMVGDGINDSPALEKATIGIAVSTGSDIAMESADIIIVGNSLSLVEKAIRLSRKAINNIKLSLFWAFFYNILSLPIAAGVLTLFNGPSLNPMLCALCMSLSSISVTLNALRLKRFC